MTEDTFMPTISISRVGDTWNIEADWDGSWENHITGPDADVSYDERLGERASMYLDRQLDAIRAAIANASTLHCAFEDAADSDSFDDEHEAAVEMGLALLDLCNLIEPFFQRREG